MKRILPFFVALLMLFSLSCAAAEGVIINKITNPDHDFAFPEDAKLLEIYFPKIYDCAGAFIRYGEYTMLFDTAGDQWEQTAKMLDMLNVTELTYACNSHPHTDHIYGYPSILKKIPAGEFQLFFDEDFPYSNDCAFKIYDELHAMNIPFHRLLPGDTIEFGDVQMQVMQQTDPELSGNNQSAILKVSLGERSFLFASDIQADAQKLFLQDGADLKADILQHPHHGYNPMNYTFLKTVDPELVIVTSMPAFAKGVDQLKRMDYNFHYTNLGIMKMTTDGNVWLIERIK